jgi:glucoamylase
MYNKIGMKSTLLLLFCILLVSCYRPVAKQAIVAPGAPGDSSFWCYAGKTGIGTSYEAYWNNCFADNALTGTVSKVWFSLSQGILTETMYGLIHEAQLKEMQFIVVGDGFVDCEKTDMISSVEYLYTDSLGRPLSLAYRIVNKDKEGKYEIEKHIFTNPDENALFVRTIFRSFVGGITPYLYINPHVNNTGSGDMAYVNRNWLTANDSGKFMTLHANKKFRKVTAGFVGVSDGLKELMSSGSLSHLYNTTGEARGNVAMIAQLDSISNDELCYDFVLGFGESDEECRTAASNTLDRGYKAVLAEYNGEGREVGWEDYLKSLPHLSKMSKETCDDGELLFASALVLKAQEDKTHAGALIASLSNPWGETSSAEKASTGYKAVWPRDFYQCAMALLSLGDEQTPLVAFEYLHQVQVQNETQGNEGATGWFMQKTQVDGQIEWVSVQLDQTAMPIMLGWRLWKSGLLNDERAIYWYRKMIQPAADFLVEGGAVHLNDNVVQINPPSTQQERWEEQSGFSPSTTAAVISGLITAADFARLASDDQRAQIYEKTADRYESNIEKTMFTTKGEFNKEDGDGHYFIRIAPEADPDDDSFLKKNNGKPAMKESQIVDAGFLELVRYGVRSADASSVVASLPELDDTDREDNLRVKYLFSFDDGSVQYPGWRRYGNDGYGEDVENGFNYGRNGQGQRGRVWPIFTGERGHYELDLISTDDRNALDSLKNIYIKAMELFANQGMMLPEQVWDGVGVNSPNYKMGEGTNSATPLAWAHAEYIKLVRSYTDHQVWDRYPLVEKRYRK